MGLRVWLGLGLGELRFGLEVAHLSLFTAPE
jgi:hypothetical protein